MAKKEEFKVYNSMTQQKEVFKPLVPGKVSMYVCGVTAYDLSHLGHARAAVAFDVLFRCTSFVAIDFNLRLHVIFFSVVFLISWA